jgi:aspartyl-tRNA(Asn)/glutamyl-tRNA(Gln) amidotransferase subunit A
MSDLTQLTIAAAAAMLRARALSPVELIEAHLARVAALDGRLGAFITVTADHARAAAKAAEAEIAAGRWRGPLHGIPIAHKDIIATAGVRTTAHSNLLREWVPAADATVAAKLEAAGAISLGKTALHEFAIGSPGADEAFPPARNPWNPDHMPGSSSSGTAAALASGMIMGGTGTDTGGSVRHPASVTAIVGMKPTFGRVSCAGVIPLAHSMDHVGPMTRTVADNAIMLQAMAGHDAADPVSLAADVPDFSSLIGKPIEGITAGIPRRFIDSIEHTPDKHAAFAAALAQLKDLGVAFRDVDPDGLVESHDAGSLIITYEAYQLHRLGLMTKPDKYAANFRARFAKAHLVTRAQYEDALAKMKRLRTSVAGIFAAGVDVIVNPARERPAQTMAELYAEPLGKRSLALRMYSLTGNPALALPMGFNEVGLPLGLQIAGPNEREDVVYQVADAYERAAGWWQRRALL